MSEFTNPVHADGIVVVGGAVGCACAFVLAREGRSVLVLEHTSLASEAFGAPAAGFVRASGRHRNRVLPSAVTAEQVRNHVLGKTIPDDAKAFDPARWNG